MLHNKSDEFSTTLYGNSLFGEYEVYYQEHEQLYLRCQFATGLIFYPIFCLFGLTGNLLSFAVLSDRKMRSSTNVYLQALAVSDSIKLLNDLAYFFTILFLKIRPHIGNILFGYLYPYAHYVFNMSVCVTSWITVSVAFERYLLVCHATRARRLCSIGRARIVSCCMFCTMALLTLPLLLRYRTVKLRDPYNNASFLDVEVTELWQHTNFVMTYTWLQNLVRAIIPLLVLCTLNCFIIVALWRHKSNRRKRMSSRQRISLMLVAVILVFLVCMIPDTVMSTVFGYGYYEANFLVRAVREITDLLLLVNSALNFCLYCIFNRMFRKRFIEMFCACTSSSETLFDDTDKTYSLSRRTSLGSNYNDGLFESMILKRFPNNKFDHLRNSYIDNKNISMCNDMDNKKISLCSAPEIDYASKDNGNILTKDYDTQKAYSKSKDIEVLGTVPCLFPIRNNRNVCRCSSFCSHDS